MDKYDIDIKYEVPEIKFEFDIFEHNSRGEEPVQVRVLGVYETKKVASEERELKYSVLLIYEGGQRKLEIFSQQDMLQNISKIV